MNRLFELNSTKLHFIAVYVSEAHAADEWPLGNFACVNQHKTIEERVEAAKNFISKFNFKLPVYVDTMENSFDNTYYAWPDRYYIIKDGKMKEFGRAVYGLGFDRNQLIDDLKDHGATVPDIEYCPLISTVPESEKSINEFIAFHTKDIKIDNEGCIIS